jgi:hypothetical protein
MTQLSLTTPQDPVLHTQLSKLPLSLISFVTFHGLLAATDSVLAAGTVDTKTKITTLTKIGR